MSDKALMPTPASWFYTRERLEALRFHAASWIGTPFFQNSCTPGDGGGVSCQKLVGEIYRACGCFDQEAPSGPILQGRFGVNSRIEEFMDGLCGEAVEGCKLKVASWTRLVLERRGPQWIEELLWPGDLLGFRWAAQRVRHLGILVDKPKGIFVHVMEHQKTDYCTLYDGTWSSRLGAAWRRNP